MSGETGRVCVLCVRLCGVLDGIVLLGLREREKETLHTSISGT